MASKAELFLNKALGQDFMESLAKVELWKPGTKTTLDHEEIKTALKIVPRTIMSILIRELIPMGVNESKEIHLPIPAGQGAGSTDAAHQTQPTGASLKVIKHERDVYSGELIEDNKKVVDFKFRSIPGIGLVIMTAFELYDIEAIKDPTPEHVAPDADLKIQKLIDERLALHDLVDKVVEKKINQREALQQLILAKISEALQKKDKKLNDIIAVTKVSEDTTPSPNDYHRGMTNGLKVAESIVTEKEPEFLEAPKQKGSKSLNKFLEQHKNKLKKNEFSIQMVKGETFNCPDCGKAIFDGSAFSGCICFGDDMERKLFVKKSENGVKVRFSPGWDKENIDMLLEVLRKKRG